MHTLKSNSAREFLQCLHDALDWNDLDYYLEDIQTAFKQGHIATAEAEVLARMSTALSQGLPEQRPRCAA